MEETIYGHMTITGQIVVYEFHPSVIYGWNPTPEDWYQGYFALNAGDDRTIKNNTVSLSVRNFVLNM